MAKKHVYINQDGEEREIFRGTGFYRDYVFHKNLPFLNEDNEWVSGDIRLYPIPILVQDKHPLQIYIKQQRLQHLFGMKFKKEDLLDDKLVVGFYGYQNQYKDVYYYGIISLKEFIIRFYNNIQFPLLLETTSSPEEVVSAIDEELARIQEEKRLRQMWEKRRVKLTQIIEEERKDKIVYEIILSVTGVFNVTRYTPATKKTEVFDSKTEAKKFIESNQRGDSRSKNGISIHFYDQEIKKKKW